MPDLNEIQNEIGLTGSPFDVIRRSYLKKLHKVTGRNTIIYYSDPGNKLNVDQKLLSTSDFDMKGFMTVSRGLDRSKGLDLILHTHGGEQAATERLVDYLRSMYGADIRAFIPHLALSAGTMIACACKEIFMGNYSSLGPIDPQINGEPAQGIIDSFDQAHEEIKKDQSKITVWYPILSRYNLSLRGQCKNAIDLTKKMVIEWLSTGMFSDMDEPEAKNISNSIVDILGKNQVFKSHNRYLSPKFCKEIGLKVSLLEDVGNETLQDAVLSVHHACMHTFMNTHAIKITENHTGKAFIPQVKPVNRLVLNPQGNQPQESQPERSQPERSQSRRSQPERSQSRRSQPERSQSRRSQPERSQSRRSQPERSQSWRSQPERGQSQRGQSQRGQSQRGQSQRGQSQRGQPQRSQSQRKKTTLNSPDFILRKTCN